MEQNLQLAIQSSSSKGHCSLISFNITYNLFQFNFDQALFISPPLLICCNFDHSSIAMCIIGFDVFHSLVLEFMEHCQPLSDIYGFQEARDDVPFATYEGLELSSFKEIHNFFLVAAKVEQINMFQLFQLTALPLRFVSYIDHYLPQFMCLMYKLSKQHTSCLVCVMIFPYMVQYKCANMLADLRTNLSQKKGLM